jgi:hypothetical protein
MGGITMCKLDDFLKSLGLDKTGGHNAFNEEYSTEVFGSDNEQYSNSYSSNGVKADFDNGMLKLTYNGLLTKNGVQSVYAVIGHGDNKDWKDVKNYPMNNTNYKTFELLLPVNSAESINVAFKDSSDNWDNNSGKNYVLNNHYNGGSH